MVGCCMCLRACVMAACKPTNHSIYVASSVGATQLRLAVLSQQSLCTTFEGACGPIMTCACVCDRQHCASTAGWGLWVACLWACFESHVSFVGVFIRHSCIHIRMLPDWGRNGMLVKMQSCRQPFAQTSFPSACQCRGPSPFPT